MRKCMFLLGLAVLCGFISAPLFGQSAADAIELTRAVIQAERQAIVAQTMQLTEQEGNAFWPIYRQYRGELAQVGDRWLTLVKSYAEHYENLSDELAQHILTEHFNIERANLDIKVKYIPRFKEMLSPVKVARFYQIENKLDAVVDYDIAEAVPLIGYVSQDLE
jgi:hypothetical protein